MGNEKICQIGMYLFSKPFSENRKCLGTETVNPEHHGHMKGDAARGTPFPKGGGLWQ